MAAGSLPLCSVRLRDIPDHSIDQSRLSPARRFRTINELRHKIIGGELEDFLDFLMFLFCLFNTLIPETLQFIFFLLRHLFKILTTLAILNHKTCVGISES